MTSKMPVHYATYEYTNLNDVSNKTLRILGTFKEKGATLDKIETKYKQIYETRFPHRVHFVPLMGELYLYGKIIITNYYSLVGIHGYYQKRQEPKYATIKQYYTTDEAVKISAIYDF